MCNYNANDCRSINYLGSPETQKIINPNSLLFNDTTRIRLNQSRPSINETFKLNLTQNGQGSRYGSAHHAGPVARNIRLKQSNSFRSIGSAPLRPREPPPPPPSLLQQQRGVLKSTQSRLQKSISTSSLTGQAEKGLSKSLSTNHLNNGSSSHYGNRLLTKSEISLPIALQSTSSNQASTSLKNESIYEQKDNRAVNSNVPKGSSGFETNSTKTVHGGRTALNRGGINDTNTSSAPTFGSRSKSLSDRCEALDKVLGQQHKANANSNKELNTNKTNHSRNNKQNDSAIEGKVHEPQNGEISRNNNNGQTKTSSNINHNTIDSKSQQTKLMSIYQGSTTTAERQSAQNIEIVTKENSVSEIRIYSSGTNANADNKGIYEATKNNISGSGIAATTATPLQEIHYAATDLFPANEFLNGRNQFRKPAPLPPIPTHESVLSQTRPQSTSVILIIDSNNDGGSQNNNNEGKESSSPLTYSQPIDTLTKAPFKQLPPPPPNASMDELETEECDEMSEPLYDDVINHSTTELTTKKEVGGSIGRSSIISSVSSRKGSVRKSIVDSPIGRPSHLPPEPPTSKGQIVSSTLPCLACPPSLPPPNLPSKNLSEFHHRPVVLDEDDGDRHNSYNDVGNELILDEEVDNLYNDISDGVMTSSSNHGTSKSLQSFASSMKGALLSAIKSMDFDRRSMVSTTSNHSNGSGKESNKFVDASCEGDNFIYDDTLSVRSSNCAADTSRTYYHATFNAQSIAKTQVPEVNPPSKYQMSSYQRPVITGSNGTAVQKPLDNLIEQEEPLSDEAENEPLYDDVINFPSSQNRDKSKIIDTSNSSSDSGAESEDATPPPLPAQGPPIHLRSKISAELPVIPFPIIPNRDINTLPTQSSGAFEDSGSEMSREGSMEKVIGIATVHTNSSHSTKATSLIESHQSAEKNSSTNRSGDDMLITKTRSLLHELNEKLSQLNIISPESSSVTGPRGILSVDFSSLSPTKAAISSSSESSGVEEDYNSEKNYSLSNSSDAASGSSCSAEENYKLAQVSKLVTETITMARGKFLNSMKANSGIGPSSSGSSNTLLMLSTTNGSSPNLIEEPIYEEIGGDMNRSSSPIYSDAFDAKSIFDGASRNEILSFLESIRDRLTTTSDSVSLLKFILFNVFSCLKSVLNVYVCSNIRTLLQTVTIN
jgi:hypothetical protein